MDFEKYVYFACIVNGFILVSLISAVMCDRFERENQLTSVSPIIELLV
jgi:hypothetical protein